MHQAIYSTTAKSRYALIIEDDVYFPFDIDFQAMAMSAPDDFGILQLFNSNLGFMQNNWGSYIYNTSYVWRSVHSKIGLGGTCAYLINRLIMKPIVDAMIQLTNGWVQLSIIAGVTSPCVPSDCCGKKSSRYID
jgi:hypothetical protein